MMAHEMVEEKDVRWVGCSEKKTVDVMVDEMVSVEAALMVDSTVLLMVVMMVGRMVIRMVGWTVGLRAD